MRAAPQGRARVRGELAGRGRGLLDRVYREQVGRVVDEKTKGIAWAVACVPRCEERVEESSRAADNCHAADLCRPQNVHRMFEATMASHCFDAHWLMLEIRLPDIESAAAET
jgi:hypothetical protein